MFFYSVQIGLDVLRYLQDSVSKLDEKTIDQVATLIHDYMPKHKENANIYIGGLSSEGKPRILKVNCQRTKSET